MLEVGSTKVNTSCLVCDVCVALLLQYNLMSVSGDKFRKETALVLNKTVENYTMICSLVAFICFDHYKGKDVSTHRSICHLLYRVYLHNIYNFILCQMLNLWKETLLMTFELLLFKVCFGGHVIVTTQRLPCQGLVSLQS